MVSKKEVLVFKMTHDDGKRIAIGHLNDIDDLMMKKYHDLDLVIPKSID